MCTLSYPVKETAISRTRLNGTNIVFLVTFTGALFNTPHLVHAVVSTNRDPLPLIPRVNPHTAAAARECRRQRRVAARARVAYDLQRSHQQHRSGVRDISNANVSWPDVVVTMSHVRLAHPSHKKCQHCWALPWKEENIDFCANGYEPISRLRAVPNDIKFTFGAAYFQKEPEKTKRPVFFDRHGCRKSLPAPDVDKPIATEQVNDARPITPRPLRLRIRGHVASLGITD